MIPPRIGDPEAEASLVDAVSTFIGSRPADERIAIYRWGEQLDQLRDFTRDRSHLLAALASTGVIRPTSVYLDVDAVLTYVSGEVVRVGGLSDPGLRSVVFLGGPPPALPTAMDSPALVRWAVVRPAVPRSTERGKGEAFVEVGTYSELIAAGLQVSTELSNVAAHGHLRIAFCDADIGSSVKVSTAGAESTFLVPARVPGEAPGSCDISDMLAGLRPYPEMMEFIFTDSQRERHDLLAELRNKGRFDLSVRFDKSQGSIPATAHFRGQGSIACERKSYTLNLQTAEPVYLMPNSTSNKYYALSLCLDDRYVNQYTVLRIWRQLGLFPFEFRLIELAIEGESRGMYLLVEKVEEAYRLDHSRVRSVLRRNSPDGAAVDVKYASTTAALAAAEYARMLSLPDARAGPGLVRALNTFIDLEQYLLLLASASLLQNGDYVDEVWFFSSEELMPDGEIKGRFRVAGWDPEDIFSLCHNTDYDYDDPDGLSYCAETPLDWAILSDPTAYGRFADALQTLIEEKLTYGRFKRALKKTRSDVLHYLERPDIARAMIELIALNPGAVDPVVAAKELDAKLEELDSNFKRRRMLLMERLANYRRLAR